MAKRAQTSMILKTAFPPKNENQIKKKKSSHEIKVYASLAFRAWRSDGSWSQEHLKHVAAPRHWVLDELTSVLPSSVHWSPEAERMSPSHHFPRNRL